MVSATLLVLLAASIATGVVQGQSPPTFRLANMYGDHMVLQQSPAQANIWGYVEKCDAKVTATFNDKTITANTFMNSTGSCVWVVTLPSMEAGSTAYTITFDAGNYGSAKLSDVLFGDVWVCSGQSNMQFTVPQVFNADDELEDANNYPMIRLFTVDQRTATIPQEEVPSILQPWSVANSKSVGGGNWTYFSATCWFFGKNLYKTRKYPIGLVASDWGGTAVETWSSPDALNMCKKELAESPISDNVEGVPTTPSVLWNAMIHPLLNMTTKGAVWYQGEANAGRPDTYNCTFPAMIDDWRGKWYNASRNQTTPFYFGFVQLAPDGNSNTTVGGFPVIRWAQTANYGYVPNKRMQNVFMAVAIDLGDPTSPFGSVHPRDKQDVGLRLMIGAQSVVYNNSEMYYLGMLPQSAKVSTASADGVYSIAVTFGPTDSRGKLELRYPYGFELGCGGDTWLEGTAKSVSGSNVNVEFPMCPSGQKPMQIRYCWRTDPCEFNKCPVYSSLTTPSPPFIMDLE